MYKVSSWACFLNCGHVKPDHVCKVTNATAKISNLSLSIKLKFYGLSSKLSEFRVLIFYVFAFLYGGIKKKLKLGN